MPSPNLAVTHVAAAQNQKEVTINDAVDALDNAMNQALSVAMADANLTLTGTQANRNGLIVLTGTLTASRILTVPANHRRLAIRNETRAARTSAPNSGLRLGGHHRPWRDSAGPGQWQRSLRDRRWRWSSG